MRIVEPLLGTRAEVHVDAKPGVVRAAEDAVVAEVSRLEQVFSVFEPDSALMSLRRSGSTEVAELQTLLTIARRWHSLTDGAFHPGMQPLVNMWAEAERDGAAPIMADAADCARQLQVPSLEHLDLNALAKGWIAERAIEHAGNEHQLGSTWLSIGGDIVHRGRGHVVVGIEDPHRPYDNVTPMATVEIANEALATSGSSRRWWEISGHRYSRVLDPRTGWPVDHVLSATVIAAEAAAADALATAALVLDPDRSIALTNSQGGDCLLVLADGRTIGSSNRFKQA